MVNTGSCLVLLIFVASNYAYVVDSDQLKNLYEQHLLASRLSPDLHRLIRTTKFPRIGRSIVDPDDFQWFERRSVLFPRIGKRFDFDDQFENSFFDENENQPIDSSSTVQFRDKRNVSM